MHHSITYFIGGVLLVAVSLAHYTFLVKEKVIIKPRDIHIIVASNGLTGLTLYSLLFCPWIYLIAMSVMSIWLGIDTHRARAGIRSYSVFLSSILAPFICFILCGAFTCGLSLCCLHFRLYKDPGERNKP